ncbi:DUF2231 domain-containing protein [Prosthecomicrobium pneumaticum]|uniref:Putative membrane protein n=1 Tax=Prosthecomicrobium pneumaticum TaxID=81895 RepID=A0A7W9FQT9_9HYPH|nr:DUF2231 domain-containing protein [Prosthecomicrobium pneumaticum]MBB5755144.1 putative membrane protein [Prosthecomicrobium pneumaticum]
MAHIHPPSAAAIAAHHVTSVLAQFPIVCFTLTLFTDIAYWRTANLMWVNFSSWLLFAGLVFGLLTIVAALVALVLGGLVWARGVGWPFFLGGLIVLLLASFNSLVHARDGWTAVVPTGLVVSVVTILVMILTDRLSRSVVLRRRPGVTIHG